MRARIRLILMMIFFSSAAFADSCPFCSQKVIDNQLVFESENLYVLVDYKPRVKGHLLVVPKRHVVKAHELNGSEWSELGEITSKIFTVFEASLKTDQYMVLEKNGPRAYQEIPHVHFHFIPVHNQYWWEIFNFFSPRQLNAKELQDEVNLFRRYFQNDIKDIKD